MSRAPAHYCGHGSLLSCLQGGYALCRVIKRHEAGLLQGEPAGKAKGASDAKGQMAKVPSNSSLVSSEQLGTFTSANSRSSPPPLDMSCRGMCTVAESCNNFQVRNRSTHSSLVSDVVADDPCAMQICRTRWRTAETSATRRGRPPPPPTGCCRRPCSRPPIPRRRCARRRRTRSSSATTTSLPPQGRAITARPSSAPTWGASRSTSSNGTISPPSQRQQPIPYPPLPTCCAGRPAMAWTTWPHSSSPTKTGSSSEGLLTHTTRKE
jgi:hypothetical protein